MTLEEFRIAMAEGECLCDEVEPSDRPCLTCEALADLQVDDEQEEVD